MSFFVGIEGANSDEAVDAAFGFGVAVGIGADEAEAGATDAGFFALLDVLNFCLEASAFGPAEVESE